MFNSVRRQYEPDSCSGALYLDRLAKLGSIDRLIPSNVLTIRVAQGQISESNLVVA